MPRNITFKGAPLTLVGRQLKLSAAAPDFKATTQELKEIGLAEFKGKIKVLTSFPSLDTPLCDMQVKEFNKRSTGLGADVAVIGISKDLPFAQKRFCSDHSITGITVVSDYKTSSFGLNYGLLIKELNLLARSVLIVDKSDTLRYMQVVGELTTPPDYAAALEKLKEVINSPLSEVKPDLPSRCKSCEGGVLPLPKEKISLLSAEGKGWELVEDKKLVKEFKFKDFAEAKYALDLVAVIAEEQGHHPTMTIIYNKLKVTLTTHSAGGLTENDFIMRRIIDEIISA